MSDEEHLPITLTVNGERVTRTVPVRQHLVDFLRTDLGLTGSHLGCEHGVCGACSVRVDGAVVRGCLMLAVQADGAEVVTIEGLAEFGRDRRPAGGIRRAQRAAVRVLYARHADDGGRAAGGRRAGNARGDPHASLRQLLPLHRFPRHRRRRGDDAGSPPEEELIAMSEATSHDALRPDLDRPNSYVGRTLSRAGATRAVAGRGRYTDDITLPRMLHAAFVRSPHAHARIVSIDTAEAQAASRAWR